MKRKLNLITVTLFMLGNVFFASAQKNYEDVVYLKNGSVIHGMIVEQIPNESIKIKTKNNNVFVFKVDEILKITKEEEPDLGVKGSMKKSDRSEAANNDNIKKSGYSNIVEFNLSKNLTEDTDDNPEDNSTQDALDDMNRVFSIGVHDINGYQFNPYFFAGGGAGAQLHTKMILVPMFVELRINFIAKKTSPFISLDGGYSWTPREILGYKHLGTDNKGGRYLSPAVGVKFFVKPRVALNASLAFRYQEIELFHESEYSISTYQPEYYTLEALQLFSLRFGFTF